MHVQSCSNFDLAQGVFPIPPKKGMRGPGSARVCPGIKPKPGQHNKLKSLFIQMPVRVVRVHNNLIRACARTPCGHKKLFGFV